jgi:hypothetical protein
MTEKKAAFYAYPGSPTEIAQTIQTAVIGFNRLLKNAIYATALM